MNSVNRTSSADECRMTARKRLPVGEHEEGKRTRRSLPPTAGRFDESEDDKVLACVSQTERPKSAEGGKTIVVYHACSSPLRWRFASDSTRRAI
jgi:hypothetical protein